MSGMRGQAGIGGRRSKREVIDVPERKVEDKSLDKLLHVRKQRLDRFEREKNEAREAWRKKRRQLREMKEDWRMALQDAKDFWAQARADFFRMATTSGEFRRAKATYERMKARASQMHLECKEAVPHCRAAGTAFFAARKRVLEANKQQEKLTILRDEMRLLTRQSEM